ncbi:MAG: right-handed parallel beta-helix repeat-containing protein [Verrucomicrobiota bacterium]
MSVSFTGSLVTPADWRGALLANRAPSTNFGALKSSAPAFGLQLITSKQPENIYGLQTVLLNQISLKKGDTLFIRFAARSIKADVATGVTKLRVGFSKNSPNWDSSYSGEIGLGADWQRFDIPFTCHNDFVEKEARLFFMFGYPEQVAEIADVQVIRYGPEVSPASLPKTKRFADPVSPQVLAAEIARIAAMRNALAVANPAPAQGRTWHVSPKGNAAGNGSVGLPFGSIPQALAVVKPGDTILVAAGNYREVSGISIKVSGQPSAWIKIKAAPGARPKVISSGWHGFALSGGIAYIEIEGFELEWIPDPKAKKQVDGVGIAPAYASHHLRFLNNVIHGFGTGGICSLDCDYLHLEGNVIYNTAKTSPYGGSAISLCRAFNLDENPGYHNVVRGNVCYDNELLVSVLESSGGNGRTLTDGNGIIIDVFNRSRANPRKPHTQDRGGPLEPYRGRTLVENNLIYDNGGRGIHVFRSAKVDVINNTCYMNQKSADINAGEFTAIEASHITFLNNIAYGRKEKRGNTQDGSTRIIWSHNLFYSTADTLLHDGVVEADPQFTAPDLKAPPENFRLQPGSPALGRGLTVAAPPNDITGTSRPNRGPIDLGAYQRSK